ncbi:MAG TPA: hypothetical protein VLY63_15535, partial [Anaerolineae bacterium]|nr:hypothetical protein [Anaerolineae bacterium]
YPEQRARTMEPGGADAVIQCLHGLVTQGPWDLDIAAAMFALGYDEVKWAEGQGMLAELVSSDAPTHQVLAVAQAWYEEAAAAAHRALAAQPQLLSKLGLIKVAANYPAPLIE